MQTSIAIDITPVFIKRNFFLSIFTGISVPPVVLPILKISPSPSPNSVPPITAEISTFCVMGRYLPKAISHTSIRPEESKVENSVDRVKFFPKK